jgi:hypothetical protein
MKTLFNQPEPRRCKPLLPSSHVQLPLNDRLRLISRLQCDCLRYTPEVGRELLTELSDDFKLLEPDVIRKKWRYLL